MATVRDVREKAGEEPITMLTAYDAPTAEIVDDAGVDIVLVGDSVGNAVLGYETTVPVSVDDIAHHVGAVSRATEDALVVADMPFLSFGIDERDSLENAGRMLKEEGAQAIKLECGPHTVELTETMVQLGIPVMAHLGLTPQHVNQYGGYPRQGTDQAAAERMLELALAHEEAGAFALVLEHVPSNVAAGITEALEIPTIGIGAGPDCDGQVLVFDDAVGISEWTPSFSKQFGNVRAEMESAVDDYVTAVESGEFPADEHSHEASDLEDIY
ncbi:3-methyl-2-oxobutanoate hydroxymethyltransferase [Natronolimnohabitans sp. A-GB9]|uniref:3-methyl-2-oxobutanoate hydroxymethyltransferase n=1 Tax=Natronolimnohabitans sp. A-GB9 TaxID=3069757 RepID=UPI0027B22FB2|nr:3-methyl-2-oxobutanoate hydroxymethyltransferase [Natronolimnohabitans sp. A-GB9]MDQ2051628.1 3-methyl-2-oxobutanoate hydroxymethyltransferase [Natronolimnohabitans sp. A-GB9]